eukprot:gene9616-17375_t
MARLEIRRFSDPDIARGIHDAIKKTVDQKQCPIFERIFRALVIDGYKLTQRETEHQLKYSVKDGLITEVKATSNHGQNKGKGLIAYRLIPSATFEKHHDNSGHDWYCWECHREGEVALCSKCPRVFHKRCIGLSNVDLQKQFVCSVCKDLETVTPCTNRKDLADLNTMFTFAISRMKQKADDLYHPVKEDKEPYYKMFVYKPVCFEEIEKRVAKKEFTSVKQFVAEIDWIYHNAVVYHSAEDGLTELAKTVISDGKRERKPHDVGYAKLGSDPPWPAKILRRSEDGLNVDVRFFGPPHQRAWIPAKNIFDLSYKPPLKKKSKIWNQAIFELNEHVRILKERKLEVNGIKEIDEILKESEKPETPPAVRKRGRKKRKLTSNLSCDSDGNNSESLDAASVGGDNGENGDINMDSMRMTDDYKMIAKLRETVEKLESTLQETRTELEEEKLTNEKLRQELGATKKESEEAILGMKEELQLEAQREKASAIELYKKEMQVTIEEKVAEELEKERMKCEERIREVTEKERNDANEKLTESVAKERSQAETRLQAIMKKDREEFQRNIESFRRDAEGTAQRQVEELTRKLKSEELEKRIAQENVRRAQMETDRIVRDAIMTTKKKSWCSNCSSEAFYHCCWNTNYCSTDCQRVHWAAHRYQCTRDLMNTCRNCQQRQTFPGAPPPNFGGPQLQPK